MKKVLKNRIFIVLITLIIGVSGTLYATTKYNASEVIYNPSSGDSMTVNEALNELYNDSKIECEIWCTKKIKMVEVGDYVKMRPTSTSYTIPSSLTGCNNIQTINPSELNLWRIIKINADGTMDMISEHASSTKVCLGGGTGYKNLVGILNLIASQYENEKYTIGSKIIGYNGQTEYLTDYRSFSSSTTNNNNETLGGGDIMYLTDTNLVTEVLGTLVATNPSGTATSYWLGSRYFFFRSSDYHTWIGPCINENGSVYTTSRDMHKWDKGSSYNSFSDAIRPILTLKSGLAATGSGTSDDPWVLE